MLLLIPLLPFLGFLLNAGGGRRLGRRAAGAIACSAIIGSFAVSALAVRQLVALPPGSRAMAQPVYEWISSGEFNVSFGLRLDPLSAVMVLVVTFVGSLIHVYSTAYMHEERDSEFARYFSYLNLFAAFMLVLVLGANFLVLFVGWEGVGLCSYLLVGFWYEKRSACDAGKKAFIVNRIGDVGFLLGVLMIFARFGTLDFQDVARSLSGVGPETTFGRVSLMTLLLFVGATGKSAQIPLYVWLPDAMEGPTPVSALIHAATMVTAGVYMVSRSHMIFERAPMALTVVAVIGTLTALFAATIGITQTDIKKVLAYSTVSQLGYMFMACGVGAFSAGIFHLMTHAFFKGLLFLAAGSVIHAVGGEQDMRKMGGLRSYIPWTFLTMGIATLAIAGIPPFAGFWSKDEILWKAYSSPHGSWVFWFIGVITAFITSFYMFRLLFMTFFGDYHGAQVDAHGHGSHSHGADDHGHGEPHESPMVMLVPLMILAVLSVIGGLVGIGNRFEHFLEPVFGTGIAEAAGEAASRGTELLLMGVSITVAVLGFILAYVLYVSKPYLPQKIADGLNGFYTAVLNKYYVDELYAKLFVKPLIDGSTTILWQGVDRKVIDDTVNNAADGARHVSDEVRHMQSGNLRSYAGWIAAGSAVVIAYMIWMGVR
jgi:NADH-quinone oxidoreductase subunit L